MALLALPFDRYPCPRLGSHGFLEQSWVLPSVSGPMCIGGIAASSNPLLCIFFLKIGLFITHTVFCLQAGRGHQISL